jgi:hypothetical protein
MAPRGRPAPAVVLPSDRVGGPAAGRAGPPAAILAALLYVLLSTDPYLFGNGSNLEHFMNLFSVASLAFLLHGRDTASRGALAASGACLGAACLVKQIAILPAALFLPALWFGDGAKTSRADFRWRLRVTHVLSFTVGLFAVVSLAALILLARGAGQAAYDDIFHYGRALATDTLPEPGAPSGLVRWLTGNADPSGKLPWPFGSTNYLVWWGTGSWPLWLAALPSLAHLLAAPETTTQRRLIAGWTLAALLQVILPGLYWQHYYLLPTPGIALVVATALADGLAAVRGTSRGAIPRSAGHIPWKPALAALVLSLAILATAVIQVRSYLLVPPQDLTVKYKGGAQWVALRALGRELARRKVVWRTPRLYIWGWQSPLHFYGRIDGASRHFFVDNLLRDQADRDHPLIQPRVNEIAATLREHPPGLIFAGYPPFPALRKRLEEGYLPSGLVPPRNGLGLWVDRDHYASFETYSAALNAPEKLSEPALRRSPLREPQGQARSDSAARP